MAESKFHASTITLKPGLGAEAMGSVEYVLESEADAKLERLKDRIADLEREVEHLQSQVPHPGDGSCDNCGAIPSVDIPTALCPDCLSTLCNESDILKAARWDALKAAIKPTSTLCHSSSGSVVLYPRLASNEMTRGAKDLKALADALIAEKEG